MIIASQLIFLFSYQTLDVQAQSEPYVLSTSIVTEPVSREDCLALIQQEEEVSEGKEEIQKQLDAYHLELSELEGQYQEINDALYQVKSELDQTSLELDKVVEIFLERLSEDESFIGLNEEEQIDYLNQQEEIKAWKSMIESQTEEFNQLVAQQQEIKLNVEKLVHQIDLLSPKLETDQSHAKQLNQCLLYPYSVPKLDSSLVILDQDTLPLENYLAHLDQYLTKLVPYAYQKVKYKEIYEAFTQHLQGVELENALYGKENTQIDDYSLNFYSYAKEFSLLDLEIMANRAQYDYLLTEDEAQYRMGYEKILNLKESQWKYFYSINESTWQVIKTALAEYLNQHDLKSEEVIDQVRQLHEIYQMKLVLFDESNRSWMPYLEDESGYYTPYQMKDVEHYLDKNLVEESEELITSVNSISEGQDEKLKRLKDQLTERENKRIEDKALAKPSFNQGEKKEKNKSKAVKLPSTGEQAMASMIAIFLLALGLSLLVYSKKKKMQYKKQLEDMYLD